MKNKDLKLINGEKKKNKGDALFCLFFAFWTSWQILLSFHWLVSR